MEESGPLIILTSWGEVKGPQEDGLDFGALLCQKAVSPPERGGAILFETGEANLATIYHEDSKLLALRVWLRLGCAQLPNVPHFSLGPALRGPWRLSPAWLETERLSFSIHYWLKEGTREVRIRLPTFVQDVYFSRGTLPQKRAKGHYWGT